MSFPPPALLLALLVAGALVSLVEHAILGFWGTLLSIPICFGLGYLTGRRWWRR